MREGHSPLFVMAAHYARGSAECLPGREALAPASVICPIASFLVPGSNPGAPVRASRGPDEAYSSSPTAASASAWFRNSSMQTTNPVPKVKTSANGVRISPSLLIALARRCPIARTFSP